MRISIIFLFLTLYAGSAVAFPAPGMLAPQDSIGVTEVNGKRYLRYMVSAGETIYRISTTYKISITDLMEINPELENGLRTGQIINIPIPEVSKTETAEKKPQAKQEPEPKPVVSETYAPAANVHVVQPGETYYGIARKYGLDMNELLRANGVELQPGQELVIPEKKKTEPVNAIAKQEPKPKEPAVAPKKETPEKKEEPEDPDYLTFEPKKPQTETLKISDPKAKTELQVLSSEYESIDPGYNYVNDVKRILVVPFDPYLYFSDADDEISKQSNIHRTQVRQAFRRRLNALLEPEGFKTIHLLGGNVRDSITDLNKVYSSVTYSYMDIINREIVPEAAKPAPKKGEFVQTLIKKKEPEKTAQTGSRASLAKDEGKYFGVIVKDPGFWRYFNQKYKIDYYVFVNQFEVKTDYEHCLDRATQNYERNFITHFSIFDATGKQVSGNRIKTYYESNSNTISKILNDNMEQVADKIIKQIPR